MKNPFENRRRAYSAGVRAGVYTAALLAALSARAAAVPPAVVEAVPSDVVVGYFANGPVSGPKASDTWSTLRLATLVVERAHQTGLLSKLDACTRAWVDAFGSAAMVLEHPLALVLFDIHAKERADGGHELAGLHAALIVHTGGDNDRIERRIQHLLSVYTNDEDGALVRKPQGGSDGEPARWFFTMRDRRLPPWASITWGAIGDYYVVAIGDGAYDQIAATVDDRSRSLAGEKWFVRAVSLTGRNGQSDVSLYVRLDDLRKSADPRLEDKIKGVQDALGITGVDRVLWTFGRDERSVEVVSVVSRGGRDEVRSLAGDVLQNKLTRSAIPNEAGGYAAIACDPKSVWRGVADAFLAAKSPDAAQQTQSLLDTIEASAAVSIEGEIISCLTGPIVIHNHPPHMLRLPLMWTILVPIRCEAALLRSRIDRVLGVVEDLLHEADGVQIHRDFDNIWYLQYGLAGPALAVTDRWLIISHSPAALRQNLSRLSNARPVASHAP